MLKKMKLAPKIAIIISVILTVIFVILIGYTVIATGTSLTNSISAEVNEMSKSNGIQVQQIIDAATKASADMEAYLQKAYKISGEGKINMAGDVKTSPTLVNGRVYLSTIYKQSITELSADVEKYITETARNTATKNPDIVGVGAMFEPYAFDENIRDYAFYVSETIADDAEIQPYGAYETYENEIFYKQAKELKRTVFTVPYEFNGVTMVTAASPIIYNDKVMGVIMSDMNVTNFSKITSKSDRYKTLYASVFDENGILVYDSEKISDVGKNMEVFYPNKDEYNEVLANFQKGEAFSIETTREDNSVITRFYNPIQAGATQWWALTALDTSDLKKETTTTAIMLILISILALVVIVFITVWVLTKMLKPIQTVVEAATDISNGNFNINLTATSQDEIGILTNTFSNTARTLQLVITDISSVLNSISQNNLDVDTNTEYVGELTEIKDSMHNIITNLNSVMGDINVASEQVASGSDQVSSGAQALSQGATEQASSVEELAATMAEISEQIKVTAANAVSASQKANTVGSEANESNSRMQEMLTAMGDISDRSSEIGKIIKTIEDIAFQTNILALNAAVEAARAGAAGKGFAVVADEVRNLASKSSEAAKNTTALISGSIEAVNNGKKIADATAQSLETVVLGIQEVAGTIDKISSASDEQARSIAQVNQGVDQISSVVQTNSATAEESAAASEELSGQAQTLKGLVGKFKLKKDENDRFTMSM